MPDEKVYLPDEPKGDTVKSRDFGMNPDAKRVEDTLRRAMGPFDEPIQRIVRMDDDGVEVRSICSPSPQHEIRQVRLDCVGLAFAMHKPVGSYVADEPQTVSQDAVLATAKRIIELVEGA